MGVAHCGEITARLQAGGLALTTPAAVIQSACTPQQRSHTTVLAELADDIERLGITAPAILIIGDVVRLAQTWSAEELLPEFSRAVV
jgi:siroheme synthase